MEYTKNKELKSSSQKHHISKKNPDWLLTYDSSIWAGSSQFQRRALTFKDALQSVHTSRPIFSFPTYFDFLSDTGEKGVHHPMRSERKLESESELDQYEHLLNIAYNP